MSKRKLVIAAGVLILAGGAAAIAAVGHREGRMGRHERMQGMEDFAQMHGPGMGEGRWGGRHRHGDADGRRDPDMRRGWLSRSITAEEYDARIRERFARLDKNSDGVIDAAEAEAVIGSMSEHRARFRDRMMQRFSARYDADRDGKVTRQEALERARRDFARMDLDGDGRITDSDLPPIMRGRDALKGEGGFGRGRMMLGRLAEADANKDGIITQEEFLAAAGRRFDLADRNKDGAIDKADRDLLGKEMTDYRVRRFMHAHGSKDNRVTREQFTAAAKERFAQRDINNDGRIDREDGWRGRGMHRGPGHEMGPGGGMGGPGGMRERTPPR